jgi:hypothetical protein
LARAAPGLNQTYQGGSPNGPHTPSSRTGSDKPGPVLVVIRLCDEVAEVGRAVARHDHAVNAKWLAGTVFHLGQGIQVGWRGFSSRPLEDTDGALGMVRKEEGLLHSIRVRGIRSGPV